MREILFRGKAEKNGEWVYGSLIVTHGGCIIYSKYHPLVTAPPETKGDYSNQYIVNPSTVGQYTGKTDKNGKKIFEGDIVKVHANDSYFDDCWGRKDYWVDVVCLVVYDRGRLQFNKRPADKYYSEFVFNHKEENLEIIGNIHDNPELLKDKPDD